MRICLSQVTETSFYLTQCSTRLLEKGLQCYVSSLKRQQFLAGYSKHIFTCYNNERQPMLRGFVQRDKLHFDPIFYTSQQFVCKILESRFKKQNSLRQRIANMFTEKLHFKMTPSSARKGLLCFFFLK